MSVHPSALLVRAEGLLHTELEGQTVLLNVSTGTYHGLDEVATRIWEILETPTSLSALVDQLALEFDVDRAKCIADVLPFVEKMADAKLVVITPSSGSADA